MTRKGISFTLTLVVIGVVLLMTALTVIVLGGGEIGDFLLRGGQASGDASVSEACGTLGFQIDQDYCNLYLANGDCSDLQHRRTSTYDERASEARCDYANRDNSNLYIGTRLDRYSDDENCNTGACVEVGGQVYDCIEEGELTRTCPAS